MTNWPAIGIVIGAELTVFFAATVRCFTAKPRIDRERDGDIRAAIAGYEAGQVIPALTRLVEEVINISRPDDRVVKALSREARGDGEDFDPDTEFRAAIVEALDKAETDSPLNAAVDAAIKSRTPRAMERALTHRYTALGVCLLACHLAGPAGLYNVLTPGYDLPRTAVIVAVVVFSIGILGALLLAILVAMGDARLSRVIREGKDAA